jgi:hypothetical protein
MMSVSAHGDVEDSGLEPQSFRHAAEVTEGKPESRLIGKQMMSVSAHGDVEDSGLELQSFRDASELDSLVNDIVEEVEGMAREGTKPQPDKIKVIKDMVTGELIPDLNRTRQSSVDQIAVTVAAIKECNRNGVSSQRHISQTTEVSVETARSTHTSCRMEEKKKESAKGSKCKELDDFLDAVAVPEDMPTPKERAQMVKYTQTMSEYFCPKGPTVTSLSRACKQAEEDHTKHKAACDRNQAVFESAFCTWRTQTIETCTALGQCYERALATHNEFVAATKTLVKKWKIQYTSLKKIICYTDVWMNDNDAKTVDAAQLDNCREKTVDTSPMDVVYPEVPAQADCPTTKVDTYPGTEGFPTTEYKDFSDLVVAVIACLDNGNQGGTVTAGPPTVNEAPVTIAPSPVLNGGGTDSVTISPPNLAHTAKPVLPPGHGFVGKHIVNWGLSKTHFPQAKGICGLELDDNEDALRKGGGGEWVEYFKSGQLNAGCGGACNGDNGVNIECHHIGKSKGALRGVNAYAKTKIVSDADKEVTIELGSDDGFVVWLNGNTVFENLKACHCYKDNQYSHKMSLKKGDNILVIKIGENDGHFGFIAGIREGSAGLAASEVNL